MKAEAYVRKKSSLCSIHIHNIIIHNQLPKLRKNNSRKRFALFKLLSTLRPMVKKTVIITKSIITFLFLTSITKIEYD